MNCPHCQIWNPEQAKFCMNCGARLVPSGPSSRGQTRSAQFKLDRYLPQELITKLESARARNAMVGERRVITMLFCDVKGSTAAAEMVDPEIWTEIMNDVFDYMIRPVYKYEGLVPRLMGDAILAFFGAPITHEDDPRRAVLAGLEILEGIKSYSEEVRRTHGLEFGLRVGINTGLVVVGEIGSDLRMEYTAIGDAINLAARMEQTAAVGTIQISDETYKLVAPFFNIEPLGEVRVKGKSSTVKTYRVLGTTSIPGHLRGLEGMSSPLVGREEQLALLHRKYGQLKRGVGSFVAVIGEAGLGKSKLIAELKKLRENQGYQWLRGDALSYTRSISYFLWRQLVRQSIQAGESDSPAQVREKLHDKCDSCIVPGGDRAFIEAILAVEDEKSLQTVNAMQGDALIQRMVDATRGYLCALARESPLAIVFDDLHWADEASLHLLLRLAELANTQPMFFICMLRPDKTAPGWGFIQSIQKALGSRFDAILLEPLQPEQATVMLTNLLGVKDLPASIRDLIVEKADGNPFYVEEMIRALIETKQLVREHGHWGVMSAAAKISLPNNLRGVLGARIDRLPETAKHVLQNAAAIGRTFDLRVLKGLMDLNGEFETYIHQLTESGLIEAAREQYMFRHVLIQEAAYESILLKTRTELHRRIGQVMEALHVDRLEEFAPVLAHHFFAANDPRSLKYDILAGEKAARLYANAEAAVHFGRALEVAKREDSDLRQIQYLFSELGRVLELAGRYEEALANYNVWQKFGRERADRSIEMHALMAKAPLYSIFTPLHNSSLSQQLLVEALEISREIGDRAAQARLSWNLMLNHLFSKRPDKALEHGQVALRLARESDDREQLAYVLNDLCRLYTCRGEFDQAYIVIEEARDIWRSLDNQVMLADSFGSQAEAFFNAGEFDRSLQHSERALQITEKIENVWGQSYDRMLMAFVLLERGDLGRGVRLAEQSVQLADQAGLIASGIGLRSELAWIYSYCGAMEKGLEVVEKALQVAEAKQPAWKAFPQAAKIRMHLLQGDVQSAQQTAGDHMLEPISIPYARYTIFLSLANIELAVSRKEYQSALVLVEALLREVLSLTRVDIPDVLRWKGKALLGLGRIEESYYTLTEARSLAETSGCDLHFWPILADLADINAKIGKLEEARVAREATNQVVKKIAKSLHEIGLGDSFLNQPRVHRLL